MRLGLGRAKKKNKYFREIYQNIHIFYFYDINTSLLGFFLPHLTFETKILQLKKRDPPNLKDFQVKTLQKCFFQSLFRMEFGFEWPTSYMGTCTASQHQVDRVGPVDNRPSPD